MAADPDAFIWHGYDRASGKPYLVPSEGRPIGLQYRTLDGLVDAGYLEETDFNDADVIYRLVRRGRPS